MFKIKTYNLKIKDKHDALSPDQHIIQEGYRRGEEESWMGNQKEIASTERRGTNNIYKCTKSNGAQG